MIENEIIHLNPLLAFLFKDKIFNYREQAELIEDFAQASDFYNFYREHRDLYAKLITRYHQLCYFEATHSWLEDRFDAEYDSYRTIFSPLAGGFHNTIPGLKEPASGLQQTLMFVSPPLDLDPDTLSTAAMEIIASKACRKVFTEIDHNYVNPLSDSYLDEIEATIPDHRFWNQQKNGYGSAYATFNEYMTWAVFSLYAQDTYAPQQLDSIISFQENYMVAHRKFSRFRAFNRELMRLYSDQRARGMGNQIELLYPPILSWMRKQTEQIN